MIELENIYPEKIAYDRPSDKLIKFLAKHYHLRDYIPQNNNFVIFNEYFLSQNDKQNRTKAINKSLASTSSCAQLKVKANKGK